MKPEYAQDIIVGVMRKKTFCWYVTNKVIWFLDYVKWGRAFDPNAEDSAKERFDILVVDDAHEETFFEHIEPYRVSCAQLREQLRNCDDDYDRGGYHASLLVDFDKKHFISYFPEFDGFEGYVPEGWTSEYRFFEGDVPMDQRYWIDTDGRDILREVKK